MRQYIKIQAAYLSGHLASPSQEGILLACDEARVAGEAMHIAATTFAGDIYRSASRAEAASASRTLLRAVARLLAVVDAVDLCKLQGTTSVVSQFFMCDSVCAFQMLLYDILCHTVRKEASRPQMRPQRGRAHGSVKGLRIRNIKCHTAGKKPRECMRACAV